VTPRPSDPSASALPVRAPGTRSRAGNAMERTRAGLLDGAAGLVAARPPKQIAMTDIAAAAGVAKGTLYNHFRTKPDIWSALAEREIARLVEACADRPLTESLVLAARAVATHPGLRQVAAHEPAALLGVLTTGRDTPGWLAVRRAVDTLLDRAGRDRAGADLVLRWLSSYLWAPGGDPTAAAGMIAGALPAAAGTSTKASAGRPLGPDPSPVHP
jgi:AcrR family transcriptional regulator